MFLRTSVCTTLAFITLVCRRKSGREYSTDRLTGQPLFKPMINPVSSMIMEGGRKDRYATGVTDVGEALYRNAFNRQLRHIIAAHKADEREKSK